MKALLIYSLLFLGPNSHAQDTLAKASIHTWAGGQCCSNGTDISITLTGDWGMHPFDSLVYYSTSGYATCLFPDDFHAVKTSSRPLCSLTYGWSNNRYGTDYATETNTFYGLPGSRVRVTENQTARLLVYSKGKVIRKGIVDEQFSLTAYP